MLTPGDFADGEIPNFRWQQVDNMAATEVPHLHYYVTNIQKKILFIVTPSTAGKMMDFSYF